MKSGPDKCLSCRNLINKAFHCGPPIGTTIRAERTVVGRAALSIALSRLGSPAPTPEQTSRLLSPQRVPLILATPPWALHWLARKLGYSCRVNWRGSLDHLTGALEAGHSIIVLIRPLDFTRSPSWALHYRSVAGIETDESGAAWVWLACSSLGNGGAHNQGSANPANLRLSVEELMDQWLVYGTIRWMLELWAA